MRKKTLFIGAVLLLLGITGCGSTKVILGEYKGIPLEAKSDEYVNRYLEYNLMAQYSEVTEVTGPAYYEDTVVIDYRGLVLENNAVLESGTGREIVLGYGEMFDELESEIVGMCAGETKEIAFTLPEYATTEESELANQTVFYTVTVKSVKRSVTPELTDEFVKEKFGLESVAELKARTKASLNYYSYADQIMEILLERCKVKNLPEKKVEDRTKKLMEDQRTKLKSLAERYGMTEQQIIVASGYDSIDEVEEECRKYAEEVVAYSCIVLEIAKQEKLTVAAESYDKTVAEYAKAKGFSSTQDFIDSMGEEELNEALLMEEGLKFVIKNAKIF